MMRYTRAITTKVTPLVQARFAMKQALREFAMSPNAIQDSGANSMEKQLSGVANNVTKSEGNLDTFRNIQRETAIDKTLVLKKRMKDSKKTIKTPVLPVALKESIRNEENKNKISPLI